MKRNAIERKISLMQKRLAEVTHPKDIAACNRVIEMLIMLDADDEQPGTTRRIGDSDATKKDPESGN